VVGQGGKVFTEPDEVCGWRGATTRCFRAQLAEGARWQPVKRVAEKEAVSQGRWYSEPITRLPRGSWRPGEPPLAPPGGWPWMSSRCARGIPTRLPSAIWSHGNPVRKRREVLEVVEGQKAQSVQAYLEKLPEPERVEAVVMDMHEPYR